jgi:hypothetical protein
MRTKIAITMLVCTYLFASGCGSSNQNMLVGKWEAGEGGIKIVAEFGNDGAAKLTMFGQEVQGTYKVSGDELEWTMNGKTTKSKMKVSGSELELTSEGKTIKYKKV